MIRRRWYVSVLLGMLWLVCQLTGCAKPVPLAPQGIDGGQSTAAPDSPGSGGAWTEAPGRLNERDRSVTEGRMSGDSIALDPEAARQAFLNEDVLFAYNSFTLTEEARQLLEQKAQWLVQHPEVSIRLEGHCDERGTVAYNLALGERRANAVQQYMTALGVNADRMTTISYGEEFPLDPGHHEVAWARNRRAHFDILNP